MKAAKTMKLAGKFLKLLQENSTNNLLMNTQRGMENEGRNQGHLSSLQGWLSGNLYPKYKCCRRELVKRKMIIRTGDWDTIPVPPNSGENRHQGDG